MSRLGIFMVMVLSSVKAETPLRKMAKPPSAITLRAMPEKIVCHSPRLAKTMVIKKTGLSFIDTSRKGRKREIASVVTARTKKTLAGLTKIAYSEGKKYTIHIKNVYNLSPKTDAVTIRTSQGHEITYPLNCAEK